MLKLLHGEKMVKLFNVKCKIPVSRFKCDFDRLMSVEKNAISKGDRVILYESSGTLDDLVRLYKKIQRDGNDKKIGVGFERACSSDDEYGISWMHEFGAHEEDKHIERKCIKLGVLCVARRNAEGYRDVLQDRNGRTLYDRETKEGELLIFDDSKVDHYNTKVLPVNNRFPGHVDTIQLFEMI